MSAVHRRKRPSEYRTTVLRFHTKLGAVSCGSRAGRSQSCVFTTYKGQARQLLPSSSPIPSRSPPWTISAENCIIIRFLSFFRQISLDYSVFSTRSCTIAFLSFLVLFVHSKKVTICQLFLFRDAGYE